MIAAAASWRPDDPARVQLRVSLPEDDDRQEAAYTIALDTAAACKLLAQLCDAISLAAPAVLRGRLGPK